MKIPLAFRLLLAGVAATSAVPVHAQAPNPATAVQAFVEICLKTAPSFSGATEAAKRFGIVKLSDTPTGKLGVSKDETLILQIKEGKECLIDMPPVPADGLVNLFSAEVAKILGTVVGSTVPFRANVGSDSFIFNYERRGFHRFLMLKADA